MNSMANGIDVRERNRTVLVTANAPIKNVFEKIKDYNDGTCTKLFTGGLASRSRVAMMLGLPKETHVRDLVEVVRERLKNPVEPKMVKNGPVKQNMINRNIDLYKIQY